MYTRSVAQEYMFKSAASVMEPHTRRLYEDRNAWHIELITGGMQGKPSKYDRELDDQHNLTVTNKESGVALPAVPAKTKKEDAPLA